MVTNLRLLMLSFVPSFSQLFTFRTNLFRTLYLKLPLTLMRLYSFDNLSQIIRLNQTSMFCLGKIKKCQESEHINVYISFCKSLS